MIPVSREDGTTLEHPEGMLRRSEDPSRLACGFVALGALCGPLSSALEGFYPRLLLLGVWLFSAGRGDDAGEHRPNSQEK